MINKIIHYEESKILAYCSVYQDMTKLSKLIENKMGDFDFVIREKDVMLAFEIIRIDTLTNIYRKQVYMVNFGFINVDRYFNNKESALFEKLIIKLNERILEKEGYYIIRVPSHIPMLIEQINKYLDKKIFTGGTIHYASKNILPLTANKDDIEIIKADKKIIELHSTEIERISKEAFDSYFGQYHISHFTRDKAAQIYLNWTINGLHSSYEDTLLALYDNKVVGFLIYESKGLCGELILSGVDDRFKGRSIYYRMIHMGCSEMVNNNAIVFSSTQFDNMAVQKVWIKMGLKPHYSFYLFHVNNVV